MAMSSFLVVFNLRFPDHNEKITRSEAIGCIDLIVHSLFCLFL